MKKDLTKLIASGFSSQLLFISIRMTETFDTSLFFLFILIILVRFLIFASFIIIFIFTSAWKLIKKGDIKHSPSVKKRVPFLNDFDFSIVIQII